MGDRLTPEINGILRRHMIRVPQEIECRQRNKNFW